MDSDDEIEEFHAWRGVPATVVLINVFDSRKIKFPEVSHAATCRLIRNHLRQASSHYLGVCFYGIDESDTSSFGSQNVQQIIPLSLPNLDDYKKLQNRDISSYGQAKELIMSDALWHCSKMFANCKKQLLNRTILLLTSFDTPPVETDQEPTYTRVREMVKSDIEIKLINVSDKDYEPHKFYEKFLMDVLGSHRVNLPKPVWDYKEIESSMYKQSHRNLAIAQLSFKVGEGFEIGVGVYSLLKSNYQPKKTQVDRDTSAVVARVNKTLKVTVENNEDDDANENKQLPLLKSEILHSVEYGGKKIEFNDQEKKNMTNPFGPPMLKLLGFKPKSLMSKEKWYFKPGYFLFPNENIVEGSTAAFKALHKACIDMLVVAICMLNTRVNSKPSIVALSPCSHPLGLDTEIGFDVIRIPTIENVRQLLIEEDEIDTVSQEHKDAMKDIINKLKFDYTLNMFENPKLQTQYRAIEAIALGDEEMEPFVDTTKADPAKFNEIQEDAFEELFGPFGIPAPKRAAAKESGVASKKAKTEPIDEVHLQNCLKNKKIHTYTVAQLKDILQSKNIPNLKALTGLKKNDLVNLVYEHFG